VPEERSSGIILRTRPLTETSLIVHWITPDYGRLATVAKGARRPQSPFRGKLDLFHAMDFTFSRSRRSELHTLREAVLRQTHPALRRDITRLQQAAYAVALLELATETETPLPELFHLFNSWLNHLQEDAASELGLLAFEARALHELGWSPHSDRSRLSQTARPILAQLLSLDWPQLSGLRPAPAALRELERFLGLLLAQHLGRMPRGRQGAFQLQ
jgi:DNA repair protein RecO (recombination protein O)